MEWPLYRLPYGAGGSQNCSRTIARRKTLTRRKLKNHVNQHFHFGATVPYRIPQYRTLHIFRRIIKFGAYNTVQYSTVPRRTASWSNLFAFGPTFFTLVQVGNQSWTTYLHCLATSSCSFRVEVVQWSNNYHTGFL